MSSRDDRIDIEAPEFVGTHAVHINAAEDKARFITPYPILQTPSLAIKP